MAIADWKFGAKIPRNVVSDVAMEDLTPNAASNADF
jgi:hypothetical protein